MIRHTPQEIADFFGCYVVQTAEGSWILIRKKPVLGERAWVATGGWPFLVDNSWVEVPADHDWTKLYEPRYSENQPISDNKPDPYYADPADSDNKAPQQSEVYTHQEYCILAHNFSRTLSKMVIENMGKGWRPVGGVAVEPLSGEYNHPECVFYQAMVRGV